MKISLIGPGDLEFHYQNLLNINNEKLQKHINKIAKALAKSDNEIIILPDKGISLEIAKKYKEMNGKKVIAAIPKSDNTFGIKHIEQYIDNNIFNEIIDTENWFKHDLIKGLLGNAILYLGSSPGTDGELNYALYLYKIITRQKENLQKLKQEIHPNIEADENLKIFVYSPFLIKKRLKTETEEYIKKLGIKLIYIKNSAQLKKELSLS